MPLALQRPVLALLVLTLPLAACIDDEDDNAYGQMKLAVTDAPVDGATSVVVQFTGVELKPQSGVSTVIEFDQPRDIDLLALQGGGSELLLDGVTLPAGQYNWLRLMVNAEPTLMDSYISFGDGSMYSLFIPSGAETGLKLINGFTVPAGGVADFTLDFDLRKSVHDPGSEPNNVTGDYVLRPALRIVDNTQVGQISGTVANSLVTTNCDPVVYVFAGADVTPDDVDPIENELDPLTTAPVEQDMTSVEYRYTAAFLPAGDYTVSFTCDAGQDDPDAEDTLGFSGTQTVAVTGGETTEANF